MVCRGWQGAVDIDLKPESDIERACEDEAIITNHSHFNPICNPKRTRMDADIAELKKEVSLLRKELSRVADEAEVRKVHFKYGYYLDKCLYNEVRYTYPVRAFRASSRINR